MPSKTEEYLALAQRTANGLTRYWESWTDYLTTASRLYKYPFADQLMIYAQRPDATACAEFDIWRNRMNRYVRRGSKGIALLDESSGFPRLHYVFDVSDTGVRRNSRDPEVWQLGPDLVQPVSEMLAATYGISGERVSQQLADVAGKLVADYWDNNSEDISAIVDGSLLMDYDEAGVEMQFKSAAAISVTYTLLERCGFEPDGYFDKDSFQAIYDFSTPDTVYTLGAAVSDISREVLRTVERAVKTTIRRRNNERSQHEYEQQSELHADRGLSSPEPDPASAEDPAGQVRQDAPELSEAAAPGSVPHDAPEREPVPDPDRTGADRSSDEEATDGRSAGEEPGPGQGEESDGVGTAHEQPNLKRECLHGELSAEEQLALSELNCILSETPQWSSEEELCHDMENIGGRVRFCRFWNEHYSMVQLTEDRNGKYSTAYVLDTETTPDVRKVAALQAQKELADRMQAWGVSLLDTSVPEQMKYDFLAEAASHLMQVLNDPEHITG